MCRVGRQTLLTHSLTALNISFALPPSSLLAVKALLEADVNVNDTKIFSDIKMSALRIQSYRVSVVWHYLLAAPNHMKRLRFVFKAQCNTDENVLPVAI